MSALKEKGGGLVPIEQDVRDFSRSAVFGAPLAVDMPDTDFIVAAPLEVKDQGDTDMCTAYATCSASEDQENAPLNPEYSFFLTKVKIMKNPDSWGADLRSAMKAGVKHGFLAQEYAPSEFQNETRDRAAAVDPETWKDSDYAMLAAEHRKNAFFAVDGPFDTFDNIRAALWQHRSKFRTIVVGSLWRPSWTNAKDGIIPVTLTDDDVQPNRAFGHAFKILGWRVFDGEIHLVAVNSWGDKYGDEGFYYFPREVVNREFGPFGQYMYEDMSREEAEHRNYYKISVGDGFIVKIFKIFSRMVLDIIGYKRFV